MLTVAETLINYPKTNLSTTDHRGLRAIDFACMLRANNLIRKITDEGACYGIFLKVAAEPFYHGVTNGLIHITFGFKMPIHLVSPLLLYMPNLSIFDTKTIAKKYVNESTTSQNFTRALTDTS